MTSRRPLAFWLGVGLLLLVAVAGWLSPSPVLSQVPAGAVRVMDGSATNQLSVDAAGRAAVTGNFSHTTSVTHIAGVITAFGKQNTNVVDTANAALQVNCVVGCGAASSVVSHISSVSHVAGVITGFGKQATNVVDTVNSALQVNCVVGCSSGGTVSHITSVSHIYGTVSLVNRAGTYAGFTGTSQDVNLTNSPAVNQSGTWTIQAAHQGGEWTLRHVSGALHIAGTTRGAEFHIQGLGIPGSAHGGVLSVQGITGMVPLAAAQSGGWNVSAAQSGTWTVQAAHQGGQWTVAHVTSVSHVYGTVSLVSRAGIYASLTSTSLDVNLTNAPNVGQSGSWTVQAAHQGGIWNINHQSSVVHVSGVVVGLGKQNTDVVDTAAGALKAHVTGVGQSGNPSFCHSVAAFVVHAGTNVAPVIHVAVGWKVAICGIVLVSGAANDISLVAGNDANGDLNNQNVWSGGCGARAGASAGAWTPLVGGASRGMAIAANGGMSSIAGIPWLQTPTAGQSVCLVKQSGASHVAGTITYAGFH